MNDTKYYIRAYSTLFEEFCVVGGLKRGDVVSPFVFNTALKSYKEYTKSQL